MPYRHSFMDEKKIYIDQRINVSRKHDKVEIKYLSAQIQSHCHKPQALLSPLPSNGGSRGRGRG